MFGVDVPNVFWSLEERKCSPGESNAVAWLVLVGPAETSLGQTLSGNHARVTDTLSGTKCAASLTVRTIALFAQHQAIVAERGGARGTSVHGRSTLVAPN